MGFFDSFNKSFKEESQQSADRRERSTYRTVAQQDIDHYNELDRQSDGALINKMKSTYVSDKDKVIIDQILKNRGYRKATNGTYHRI